MPRDSSDRYRRCLCTGYDIKVSMGKAQALAFLLDFSHTFTGYTGNCRGCQTADSLGCKWKSFRCLLGGYSTKWELQRFPSDAEVCSYMVGGWWEPTSRTFSINVSVSGQSCICFLYLFFIYLLPVLPLHLSFYLQRYFISVQLGVWIFLKKSFCFNSCLYTRHYLYFFSFHFSVLFLITSWYLTKF